jgi:hypothetical protein
MEALLRALIEQNKRLITLQEQTVLELKALGDSFSHNVKNLGIDISTIDSSSDLFQIEMNVTDIKSTLDEILLAISKN